MNRSVITKSTLTILAAGISFVLLYFFLLSIISIWFGIAQMNRSGFWLPVIAGISGVILVASLFLYGISRFFDRFRKSTAAPSFSSDPFYPSQQV